MPDLISAAIGVLGALAAAYLFKAENREKIRSEIDEFRARMAKTLNQMANRGKNLGSKAEEDTKAVAHYVEKRTRTKVKKIQKITSFRKEDLWRIWINSISQPN